METPHGRHISAVERLVAVYSSKAGRYFASVSGLQLLVRLYLFLFQVLPS